jgi:hypothetical protein
MRQILQRTAYRLGRVPALLKAPMIDGVLLATPNIGRADQQREIATALTCSMPLSWKIATDLSTSRSIWARRSNEYRGIRARVIKRKHQSPIAQPHRERKNLSTLERADTAQKCFEPTRYKLGQLTR